VFWILKRNFEKLEVEKCSNWIVLYVDPQKKICLINWKVFLKCKKSDKCFKTQNKQNKKFRSEHIVKPYVLLGVVVVEEGCTTTLFFPLSGHLISSIRSKNEVAFKITIEFVVDQMVILKVTLFLEEHKNDISMTSRITRCRDCLVYTYGGFCLEWFGQRWLWSEGVVARNLCLRRNPLIHGGEFCHPSQLVRKAMKSHTYYKDAQIKLQEKR
jgi:hypothetical protein